MKNNKILYSHSDTTELPDGTKLKITVEKYEHKLYSMGEPMFVTRKIEYARGEEHRGARFIDHLEDIKESELEQEVKFLIEQIQKSPDKFKFQHAPK